MQQEHSGNTTHCPNCGRFGSPTLGGYCKPCSAEVEVKKDTEEYEGYIGDSYFSDRYGMQRDAYNKGDKFGAIDGKFGYEER